MTHRPQRRVPLRGSAAVAGLLSFELPGLGQLCARRRGIAFLVPALLLIAVAGGIWTIDRSILVRALLTPNVLLALVILDVIVLGYRLWAIEDAYLVSMRRPARRASGWIGQVGSVVVLVIATWWLYLGRKCLDARLLPVLSQPMAERRKHRPN